MMPHQHTLPRTENSRRFTALVGLALLGLGLVSCAPESEATEGGGSAPASAAPTPTAASPSTSETPTQAAGDDTTQAAGDDAGDADHRSAQQCLVGGWLADNNFFLAAMQEYGADDVKSVTGEVLVTYHANGGLTTEYRDWEIVVFDEGQEVRMFRAGTDLGEYSADATHLSFSDTQMGTTIKVSGAGMSIELPTTPASHLDLAYTCDGDTLTLTTPEGQFPMQRR